MKKKIMVLAAIASVVIATPAMAAPSPSDQIQIILLLTRAAALEVQAQVLLNSRNQTLLNQGRALVAQAADLRQRAQSLAQTL